MEQYNFATNKMERDEEVPFGKKKKKKTREFNAKSAVTIFPQANRLIHQGA